VDWNKITMKGLISIKGDKDLWLDFVYKVKKNKTQVWKVLKPFIKKYIQNSSLKGK